MENGTHTDTTAAPPLAATITGCRLLIVEDTLLSREMIAAYLRADGFTRIEFAVDGEDALEKVAAFNPDLVVLDIVMPRMDGFEVCRRLRTDPAHDRLPILVQTALDEPEERVKVFQVGATDLVTKPINKAELLARVRIHLENRMLLSHLQAYHARTRAELAMAREMQQALLPDAECFDRLAGHGVDIAAHFEPSSELGGDVWGVHPIDDTRTGLFIADFSGHGVTAALNTFRLHTLIEQQRRRPNDPGAYLTALNRRLAPLLPPEQYATMLYGVLDTERNRFTYAAAAAPRPVLGTAGRCEFVDGTGIPLGVAEDTVYENRMVEVPPGTFLFFYSDALTESPDAAGTMWEEAGLDATLSQVDLQGGAAALLDRVLTRFFAHAAPPLPDDLTAIGVVRR